MERHHFYQIPESIDRDRDLNITNPPLRLRWHTAPQLKRYIHHQIPDDYSSAQILAIAQTLVEAVRDLPPERSEYSIPQQNLSGCITALLAHILFSQRKVQLGSTVQLLQNYSPGADVHDVFQHGLTVILTPSKFLGNFVPGIDWYDSLCGYTHRKFKRSLTDKLRQQAGDGFQRTDLGLLNRCSPTKLENILTSLGEKGARLAGLLLLHQCFQEACQAEQFKTEDPQFGHYDAVLDRYRELRLATDLAIGNRDEAKKLLEYLSSSVRKDGQPGETSLDKPLGEEHDSTTLVDITPDSNRNVSPEQREVKELALDLLDKYAQVRADSAAPNSILFLLLYGLELTQAEAGNELNCNQTTIGRRRDRQLAKLARESYLSYHKLPPTTQLAIEILAVWIEDIKPLCEDYFAELVTDMWTAAIENTTTASIVDRFIDRIETRWQFKFKPGGEGLERVYAFVQQRSVNGKGTTTTSN